MAEPRITIKVDADKDVKAVLKKLNLLGKEANLELRNDVLEISRMFAGAIVGAADQAPFTAQAQRVASTVKAQKDRVPSITVGGSRGRFSGGASAGVAVFGSEFGANEGGDLRNGGRRFPDRSPSMGRGSSGYWIFPTLRALQPQLVRDWKEAVDKILRKWGQN